MKRNLSSFGIVLLVGILLINIGCDDDSRSLGKFGIDIATVVSDGSNSYSLILDNGIKLWPAATAVRYTPSYDQRVFLNYTILSEEKNSYDHYIKVNDIWNILTKEPVRLNTQNEDLIGNDPLRINDVWIGGDYLNVSFMFNYGGEQPHNINLVENMMSPRTDPEVTELEIRHNSFDSQRNKLFEGFVCFDLKQLRTSTTDSVNISIKVKEWADNTINNTKETIYDVIYRYNRAYSPIRTEMPIPVISSSEYY